MTLSKLWASIGSSSIPRALKPFLMRSQDGGISLVSVAERLQIHPSYLSKIFSQETGESFSEHLIKNKMNSARQLLKTTNKKVYEIANALGYKDVAHFTKIFKKFFGISPTEYRNLM
ncbi:MAG: helix-turn-helix transcriptional regulator [Candidatus Desulfacyla sp.]